MNDEKIQHDRRKHKRSKTCSGVFAVNSHFGLIVDISTGGLSFNYVERRPWPNSSVVEMGSLFGEDEMWIDNLSIEFISKGKTVRNSSGKLPTIKKRRVTFAELSPAKKEQVETFININTKDVKR